MRRNVYFLDFINNKYIECSSFFVYFYDGNDDEVTGIEEKAALAEEFDVYDLNGRKVLNKATSLDGLSDGVYIINGKKVLRQ